MVGGNKEHDKLGPYDMNIALRGFGYMVQSIKQQRCGRKERKQSFVFLGCCIIACLPDHG